MNLLQNYFRTLKNINSMKYLNIILMSFLVLLLGCDFAAQSRYRYSEVGQIQNAEFGTVIGVRDINIVAESSSSGGIVGGVAGAVGGAHLGGGSGSLVTLVAGAVIGANAFVFNCGLFHWGAATGR